MKQEPSRYQAARSLGWLWLLLLALACFGLSAVILVSVVESGAGAAALAVIPAAGLIILGVYSLMLSGWSNTVRYEMTPEQVSLYCGQVRFTIPVERIVKVTKTDLGMTARFGARFPGFALGKLPYAGVGDVIMCATRSLKDIILIETDAKKYGVTPIDMDAFLSELLRAAKPM